MTLSMVYEETNVLPDPPAMITSKRNSTQIRVMVELRDLQLQTSKMVDHLDKFLAPNLPYPIVNFERIELALRSLRKIIGRRHSIYCWSHTYRKRLPLRSHTTVTAVIIISVKCLPSSSESVIDKPNPKAFSNANFPKAQSQFASQQEQLLHHQQITQKCNPTAAASMRPQAAPHHPPTPPPPRPLPAARANQTSTARSSCKQAWCPRPPDPPTTNSRPKHPPLQPPTTATTDSYNRRPPA